MRASALCFAWKRVQVNLIDTPGHVDFSAEVERSLRILDCAVLVLSAVEGIQAQSEPLWDALEALGIPVIVFINKIDRMGSDIAGVVKEIHRVFSQDAILLNGVVQEGFDAVELAALEAEQYGEVVEKVAERDDGLLERYLEGGILEQEEIEHVIAAATGSRELSPVLCGAAKNQVGIARRDRRVFSRFGNGRARTGFGSGISH